MNTKELIWWHPAIPGEIVLLLNLSQNLSDAGKFLAPRLVNLIPRVWERAPYHLRLDLLQAAATFTLERSVYSASSQSIFKSGLQNVALQPFRSILDQQ